MLAMEPNLRENATTQSFSPLEMPAYFDPGSGSLLVQVMKGAIHEFQFARSANVDGGIVIHYSPRHSIVPGRIRNPE